MATAGAQGGSLILVVDDDEDFLALMTQDLTSAGHHVLQAGDASEALQLVEKLGSEINLVIADLILPGMSGYELIAELRHRRKDLKIMAVSAVYKEQYLDVATVLGARMVLQKYPQGKPMQRAEWIAAVRQVVELPPAANG